MKVLISDLDGTLYPKSSVENKNQLNQNIAAVKKWVEQGNKFVAATARGMHHYPVIAEKLGFKPNFIGSNGAEVVLESGETIIKQIPIKIFIELCEFIKENKINASAATGLNDEWLWSSKDCYPIKDCTEYLSSWDYIKVVDTKELNPLDQIERIQIFIPPKERDALKEKIIAMKYPITVTTSDIDMVDIGPENSSKGISILEICEKYKIKKEDIIVIGDSENDIPMFKLAQKSYCIDHCEEIVRQNADAVVHSVEEAIEIELADNSAEEKTCSSL